MKKFAFYFLILSLFFIPYSIFAQSVDILWQADTYTPPFYKGRALWSKQSTIKLVAIPQGLGASSGLNYRWTQNGTVLGLISGVGKNTLTYTDSVLSKPQTFKVDIVSSDGSTVRASNTITLSSVNPSLSVYENHPLYGYMFHRETGGTFNLEEREVTFAAFPYFFSTPSRFSGPVEYAWVNNAGDTESQNSVVYRTPDNSSGIAEVGVRAKSRTNVAQDARMNFRIQFDNSTPNL